MTTRTFFSAVALCASVYSGNTYAGCWLDLYWPMHAGDSKHYSGPAGSFSVDYAQSWFGGSPAFELHNSLTGATQYYSIVGDTLGQLGGSTQGAMLPFNPPLIALTEALLTNGGSRGSSTVVTNDAYQITVRLTVTVSAVGTVTVPSGTYQNCRQANVTLDASVPGVGSMKISAENWVLAPFVGQIKYGVYSRDPDTGNLSFVGWHELTSGTVGGVAVGELAPNTSILPPKITQQPQKVTAVEYGPASFRVTATGAQLSYQWSRNGVPLVDDERVAGATTPVLSIQPVRAADAGTNYAVAVGNAACVVTSSSVSLTVNPDTVKPAVIITVPTSGQRSSNAVFGVKGTASDNAQVATVWYQVLSNDWALATGTTNWTGSVTLTPGANTVRAYAVDGAGGKSPTNAVSFIYVLTAPLTVQITGKGTVSPNYDGQWLELGKSYTMTASPGAGFVFTNWTGSLSTNKAALTFVMRSNLTFTANFVDVTKPTLTITSPTSNQRWSNAVFTVKGTASDNGTVAAVWSQANSNEWVLATGTTNWTAGVTLTPGADIVRAYAADGAGNKSVTNSVSLTYVLSAPIVVEITGNGSVNPNYNGQWLELGKSYTMTASPGSGFVFKNWTGSVTSSLATLGFVMQSNLTVTASFTDITKPTLAITSPTSGQRLSNAVVTVKGAAKDNAQVAAVFYQLNTNDWALAASTNGYTNWAASVPLWAGTNTVKAYAVDPTGNVSATNSVSFVSSAGFELRLGFSSAQPLTRSGLELRVEDSTGLNCRIDVSTDLVDWVPLTRFVSTNAVMYLLDPTATNHSRQFYRAVVP